MAVSTTLATAKQYQALRTKVQRLTGDNATRFSNTDINDVLNDAMAEVHRAMGQDPSAVMAYEDVVYASAAESTALSETLAQAAIYRVEDVTGTVARSLDYVAPQELESFSRRTFDDVVYTDGNTIGGHVWSKLGRNIAIRPKDARTIRVWYITAPYVVAGDTDQHPYPVDQEEFIATRAASLLLMPDDQIPITMMTRLQELKEELRVWSDRRKGRRRVKNSRRSRF